MNATHIDIEVLKLTKENEEIKHRTSVNSMWGVLIEIFYFPFKFLLIWYVLTKFSPIIEETAKWIARH